MVVIVGSSIALEATLLPLSVRKRGGTRIGGGPFPPEKRRLADCCCEALLERRDSGCGWNLARVDGDGGPRSADETEERDDALDREGRDGTAGNGYSKSVVGPVANGVPTKTGGGDFTATPTDAIPLIASQDPDKARGDRSDKWVVYSSGLGMPSELEMSSNTRELASDPGVVGTVARSRADMVVGDGRSGGVDGAISVGLGSTAGAEPVELVLERGEREAVQVAGKSQSLAECVARF